MINRCTKNSCQKSNYCSCSKIVNNAGEVGAVVVGRILDSYNIPKDNALKDNDAAAFNYGYDAQNGVYVDMIKSGIIDPVKVVRTALVDASSMI